MKQGLTCSFRRKNSQLSLRASGVGISCALRWLLICGAVVLTASLTGNLGLKEVITLVDVNSKVGSGAMPSATGVTPPLQPTNPAYNTYVGARYVPVFSEQPEALWTPDVAYEPLTIVLHEGNSYTSKTFVPVGVEITDQEYWALTGNYNAQVEMYRQEVSSVALKVNALGGNFFATDAVITGDSYLNPEFGPLMQKINEIMNYQKYYDAHVSGGSFSADSFINAIISTANNMPENEKSNVKHVICAAGINDSTKTNTTGNNLQEKVSNFCLKAKELFPNAQIFIGFTGNSIQGAEIINGREYPYIPLAIQAYSYGCTGLAKFLPNVQYVLHDYSLMKNDGIHPTSEGCVKLAEAICAGIYGDFNVSRYQTYVPADIYSDLGKNEKIEKVNFIPSSVGLDSRVYAEQTNEIETVGFIYNTAIILNEDTALTDISSLQLGTFNCNLWSGKGGLSIPVTGYVKSSQNIYKSITGRILLNGGSIYFRADITGPNWAESTTIKQIYLAPYTVTANTLLF